MAHLHPTAELAERALLPDDPGQALALTRVLFDETPRMFNHHRGLWGYSGIALDGAPLTVQSTGIGGPSAAIVVAELHAPGPAPRGAHRPRVGARRRRCAPASSWPPRRCSRPTAPAARSARARASSPTPALTAALRGDRSGLLASADVDHADAAWEALAFDLESAAVLAAAARAGIPAACLVAIEGAVEPEDVAERLGRGALPALGARCALVDGAQACAWRAWRLAARRLGRRPPGRRRAQLDELLGDRVERALERREALVEAVDAVLDALQALGDRPHAPREALDVGRRRDVQRAEGDLLGLRRPSRAPRRRARWRR